jgi:hypothetical protein
VVVRPAVPGIVMSVVVFMVLLLSRCGRWLVIET